jgi:hypothetical protein
MRISTKRVRASDCAAGHWLKKILHVLIVSAHSCYCIALFQRGLRSLAPAGGE